MGITARVGLKLGWMLFWRSFWIAYIISVPQPLLVAVAVSVISAIVLVGGLHLDIKTFPLIRLLLRKPVVSRDFASGIATAGPRPTVRKAGKSQRHNQQPGGGHRPNQQRSYAPPAPPSPDMGHIMARPSGKGRMTGHEPAKLASYHAPISIRAHGVAGLGLFDSGFDQRNIYSGQRGEVGFYKTLCIERLIDSCSSYWSVAMPADDGSARADTKFTTDIDCVIVQGNTMYLIDLKYYASGDVTWHSRDGHWLLCKDNATGQQVGKPRKMSRNMAMAAQRFPQIFPNLTVKGYVVLIPTQDGIGHIEPGTAWPGNVELINLPDMLELIRRGDKTYADAGAEEKLLGLLKD